ncbi:MAG: UDP-glucose 4-epimerase GalE [Spirochaetaceae bacterium]
MHVVVVGGAGYIGSHVVRTFLDRGLEVTVFDNLSKGKRENLFAEARFFEGDILDDEALDLCLRGETGAPVDAVVHLAALKAAGESMEEPSRYALNNIAGSVKLFAAMDRAGVSHCVFSSSAAVYGEPDYLPVTEDHPTRPENFYGFTKLEIERLLEWYQQLDRIRSASLRYFNAAGYDPDGRVGSLEESPANLVPVVMEVALGARPHLDIFGDDFPTRDGTGVRDYIHVSDLAEAHLLALDYIQKEGKSLTVNLGSERGTSVFEVLDAARRISGREIPGRIVPRRAGDPAELVASSETAKRLLGWEPRYSDIETILDTTWRTYRRFFAP